MAYSTILGYELISWLNKHNSVNKCYGVLAVDIKKVYDCIR